MLGLLALLGLGLAQQHYSNQLNAKTTELMGTPETARAGDEGPVQVPGTGLMADPANLQKQMQFAQGLLAMPGGARALQGFMPMLQSAVQQKQFQAGQDMSREFHGDDMTWRGKDFDAARANEQRLAEQWKQQFEQQAANQAFQQQMERARLNLSYQQAGEARAERDYQHKRDAAAGSEMPKPMSGYLWAQDPSNPGQPMQVPVKGTPDYAKATEGEQALADSIGNINTLVEKYSGKKAADGSYVGGVGNEWWGQDKAAMNAQRNQIIRQMAKAYEMGVLQKEEFQQLNEALPPVDNLNWTNKKNFAESYLGARRVFDQALARHRKANPWLVPPPPPGYQ